MKKINKYLILFLFFIITLSITFLGSYLNDYFFPDEIFFLGNRSLIMKIFIGSLLGPICETFLFQYLFIKCLRLIKFKKFYFSDKLIIIFSGLIFGLLHNTNIIYIIFGVIVGMSFTYTYIYFEKKVGLNPFLSVFILHSAINTFGLFLYN
jgi:hypothetical protein